MLHAPYAAMHLREDACCNGGCRGKPIQTTKLLAMGPRSRTCSEPGRPIRSPLAEPGSETRTARLSLLEWELVLEGVRVSPGSPAVKLCSCVTVPLLQQAPGSLHDSKTMQSR